MNDWLSTGFGHQYWRRESQSSSSVDSRKGKKRRVTVAEQLIGEVSEEEDVDDSPVAVNVGLDYLYDDVMGDSDTDDAMEVNLDVSAEAAAKKKFTFAINKFFFF